MSRVHHHAQSLGASVVSLGVELKKVNLTFTGEEGATYLVFMNCVAGTSNAKVFVVCDLDGDGGGAIYTSIKPAIANDRQSVPLYFFVTLGSGVNNFNHSLVVFSNVGVITIEQARIDVLKLDPLDSIPADFDYRATVSTTYVTLRSHDIVVPTAGDYLILCSGPAVNSSDVGVGNIRFSVGANNYSDMSFRNYLYPSKTQYFGMVKVSLPVGVTTVKVEAQITTGQLQMSFLTIIALRCDTFLEAYYSESRGDTIITTFVPTYTTKVTLTQTTNNKQHLLFSSAIVTRSASGKPLYARTQLDSSDLQASLNNTIASNREVIHAGLSSSLLSNASHVATIQATKGDSGIGPVVISDACICLLELPDTPVTNFLGGSNLGSNII
jgi:hypothetical protein